MSSGIPSLAQVRTVSQLTNMKFLLFHRLDLAFERLRLLLAFWHLDPDISEFESVLEHSTFPELGDYWTILSFDSTKRI